MVEREIEREKERERTGAGGEGFCRTRVVDTLVVEFILFLGVFDLVLQTAVATEDAPSSKSNLTVRFLVRLQWGV